MSAQDAMSLTSDIKDKKKGASGLSLSQRKKCVATKKWYLLELLIRVSFTRERFWTAVELRAAGIILIHNHPSEITPSKQDIDVVQTLLEAGKIMGVNVIDFIIVSENDSLLVSFQIYRQAIRKVFYVSDGSQTSLFDLLATNEPTIIPLVRKVHKTYFSPQRELVLVVFSFKIDGILATSTNSLVL